MQKTFCLFTILLLAVYGYCCGMPKDSTGKKSSITKSVKMVSLKQSIVRTACEEFDWWRSDTTFRESNDRAIRRLKKYWLSVGRQTKKTQLKDSLWQENHPWSSVFISWVMMEAGAGSKFKPSPNHAGYVVWARRNQRSTTRKDVFVAFDLCDPSAKWPEPGDLICKNRDGNNFTLSTIKASDISHSDIVVEVDTVAKTITTIGGNLCNTVSKRIIRLDRDGFIDGSLTWQLMDDEKGNPEGSQSEFFAVVKLNTTR